MPLFGNNSSKGADMRRTNNPNVICPDDLYSQEELLRMDQAADLQEQLDALDRELMRLDYECNGADMAGDNLQVGKIEDKMEDLINLQIDLRKRIDKFFAPD